MNTRSYALEPTVDEMERMLDAAKERLAAYFAGLPTAPADRTGPGLERALAPPADLARGFGEPRSVEALLDELFDETLALSLNTAGAGYLAYVPGGGLFASAIADFVGKALNRYVGVNFAAPLLARLETDVVRWLCRVVGYPDAAKGVLTTGGSMANLTAVVAARSKLLGDDISRGVVYASEEAHQSVWKAAEVAGIPGSRQRRIPVTAEHEMDIDRLARAIDGDVESGLAPFLVVGNAGTTDTGAVDPLDALRDLSDARSLWFHADAAYGGFFAMTERGRNRLRGLDRADSVTLDPHKGLFLPYGTGALVVRDGRDLERPFRRKAAYITATLDTEATWDFSELSVELSREARGLGVWMPLSLYGEGAFREALDEKLDLARLLRERLALDDSCRVGAPPALSLVVFRYEPASVPGTQWDALNRDILARVNAMNRVHLSGTTSRGEYLIRACILSFRTHLSQVEALLEDLAIAKREALGTS